MTVEVTRIRLFFQRFSLVFYLGQIGIRQIIEKVSVGSLITHGPMSLVVGRILYRLPSLSLLVRMLYFSGVAGA